MLNPEEKFIKSRHLDFFKHREKFFVYHNLVGFIIEMSEDLLEFLNTFSEVRTGPEIEELFSRQFTSQQVYEFINVFCSHLCLVDPDTKEKDELLTLYPVRSRWIVYHATKDGPVTLVSKTRETNQISKLALSPWETLVWHMIDGEHSIAQLLNFFSKDSENSDDTIRENLFGFLHKLTHCDLQFVKLSRIPWSNLKSNPKIIPPYLKSTMPYQRITPDYFKSTTPNPTGQGTETFVDISSEDFLEQNTLAYLFRGPSEALQEQTYGSKFASYLHGKGYLKSNLNLLELGGGSGSLASTFLAEIKNSHPRYYANLKYTILCPDPDNICNLDKEATEKITIVKGEITSPPKEPFYDVVICNEVMASMDNVLMHRVPSSKDPAKSSDSKNPSQGRDMFFGEGDSVSYVFRYRLPLEDSPPEFFLNMGAIKTVEAIEKCLKPGGAAFLIEFGEQFDYPQMTGYGDQLLFSTHYNILIHLSEKLGFETNYGYVMEAFGMDTNVQMLATTRSYFTALKYLLGTFGVQLENRAYSKNEFERLISGKVSLDELGQLSFENLDNRVMGITPHAVKLLVLKKPS